MSRGGGCTPRDLEFRRVVRDAGLRDREGVGCDHEGGGHGPCVGGCCGCCGRLVSGCEVGGER